MTTSQRWGWGLLTVLITLSIVFLLMLEADATGYCLEGNHHQCGTTTTSTTTSTPPSTTSTTSGEESTTTSTLPVTTTTVPTESTTTIVEGSTSTNPLLTLWTAAAVCQTIHADFGTGITQIDVYQRLPEGDFGPADGVTPITESGQVKDVSAAFTDTEWILIPVVETGWTAVPDQISLFTAHCSPGPSTTSSVPSITSSVPELPLTGAATEALIAIAAVLSVLGFMVVKEAGRE